MGYYAEYTISGTDSVLIITDDTCSSMCATHGELEKVNISEYAAPGAHVERIARLHAISQH